jgi:hypothetical protein
LIYGRWLSTMGARNGNGINDSVNGLLCGYGATRSGFWTADSLDEKIRHELDDTGILIFPFSNATLGSFLFGRFRHQETIFATLFFLWFPMTVFAIFLGLEKIKFEKMFLHFENASNLLPSTNHHLFFFFHFENARIFEL